MCTGGYVLWLLGTILEGGLELFPRSDAYFPPNTCVLLSPILYLKKCFPRGSPEDEDNLCAVCAKNIYVLRESYLSI